MNSRTPPERFTVGISQQVLRFFGVAGIALAGATLIAWGLMSSFPRAEFGPTLRFPLTFIATTILLLGGSGALERSLHFVRQERQREFRWWLLIGLILGDAFIGTQTFALWSMFPEHRSPEDASLESTAFALALAALHGLHFLVAVLFVSWITARAWANRYDHEYFWGVRFCAWFWHALGVVWIAILFVFLIAAR